MVRKVMKKVIIKRNTIITAYNFFPSNKVFMPAPHGVAKYGFPASFWPETVLVQKPCASYIGNENLSLNRQMDGWMDGWMDG